MGQGTEKNWTPLMTIIPPNKSAKGQLVETLPPNQSQKSLKPLGSFGIHTPKTDTDIVTGVHENKTAPDITSAPQAYHKSDSPVTVSPNSTTKVDQTIRSLSDMSKKEGTQVAESPASTRKAESPFTLPKSLRKTDFDIPQNQKYVFKTDERVSTDQPKSSKIDSEIKEPNINLRKVEQIIKEMGHRKKQDITIGLAQPTVKKSEEIAFAQQKAEKKTDTNVVTDQKPDKKAETSIATNQKQLSKSENVINTALKELKKTDINISADLLPENKTETQISTFHVHKIKTEIGETIKADQEKKEEDKINTSVASSKFSGLYTPIYEKKQESVINSSISGSGGRVKTFDLSSPSYVYKEEFNNYSYGRPMFRLPGGGIIAITPDTMKKLESLITPSQDTTKKSTKNILSIDVGISAPFDISYSGILSRTKRLPEADDARNKDMQKNEQTEIIPTISRGKLSTGTSFANHGTIRSSDVENQLYSLANPTARDRATEVFIEADNLVQSTSPQLTTIKQRTNIDFKYDVSVPISSIKISDKLSFQRVSPGVPFNDITHYLAGLGGPVFQVSSNIGYGYDNRVPRMSGAEAVLQRQRNTAPWTGPQNTIKDQLGFTATSMSKVLITATDSGYFSRNQRDLDVVSSSTSLYSHDMLKPSDKDQTDISTKLPVETDKPIELDHDLIRGIQYSSAYVDGTMSRILTSLEMDAARLGQMALGGLATAPELVAIGQKGIGLLSDQGTLYDVERKTLEVNLVRYAYSDVYQSLMISGIDDPNSSKYLANFSTSAMGAKAAAMAASAVSFGNKILGTGLLDVTHKEQMLLRGNIPSVVGFTIADSAAHKFGSMWDWNQSLLAYADSYSKSVGSLGSSLNSWWNKSFGVNDNQKATNRLNAMIAQLSSPIEYGKFASNNDPAVNKQKDFWDLSTDRSSGNWRTQILVSDPRPYPSSAMRVVKESDVKTTGTWLNNNSVSRVGGYYDYLIFVEKDKYYSNLETAVTPLKQPGIGAYTVESVTDWMADVYGLQKIVGDSNGPQDPHLSALGVKTPQKSSLKNAFMKQLILKNEKEVYTTADIQMSDVDNKPSPGIKLLRLHREDFSPKSNITAEISKVILKSDDPYVTFLNAVMDTQSNNFLKMDFDNVKSRFGVVRDRFQPLPKDIWATSQNLTHFDQIASDGSDQGRGILYSDRNQLLLNNTLLRDGNNVQSLYDSAFTTRRQDIGYIGAYGEDLSKPYPALLRNEFGKDRHVVFMDGTWMNSASNLSIFPDGSNDLDKMFDALHGSDSERTAIVIDGSTKNYEGMSLYGDRDKFYKTIYINHSTKHRIDNVEGDETKTNNHFTGAGYISVLSNWNAAAGGPGENKNSGGQLFKIPFQFDPEISGESRGANWVSHTAMGRTSDWWIWGNTESRQLSLKSTLVVADFRDGEAPLDRNGNRLDPTKIPNPKNPAYTWLNGWDEEYVLNLLNKYRSLVLPMSARGNAPYAPPLITIVRGYYEITPISDSFRYSRWIVSNVGVDMNPLAGYTKNRNPIMWEVNLDLKEIYNTWNSYSDLALAQNLTMDKWLPLPSQAQGYNQKTPETDSAKTDASTPTETALGWKTS
jgi:hypothetical protein